MFALKLQGLSIIWCINRKERGEKTELYSETGAARVFFVKASYFLCSESSFSYFLGQSSIIRMNSPFSLSLSFPTHFIRSWSVPLSDALLSFDLLHAFFIFHFVKHGSFFVNLLFVRLWQFLHTILSCLTFSVLCTEKQSKQKDMMRSLRYH